MKHVYTTLSFHDGNVVFEATAVDLTGGGVNRTTATLGATPERASIMYCLLHASNLYERKGFTIFMSDALSAATSEGAPATIDAEFINAHSDLSNYD